jgi:large subunit ribosomal protein L5
MSENKMRQIKIEKMVLSAGGLDEMLEKEKKLLELVSGRKVLVTKSNKRIPQFKISPKIAVGCKVTIREQEKIKDLLNGFFVAIENKLTKKQIKPNHISFGIKEYIEIPGMEYQREIGIIGFNVTIVFVRAGRRVILKKEKRGSSFKKQEVSEKEIIKYMKENFEVEIE